MSRRHPLALVAGCSVLLAAVPLSPLFLSLTWLVYATLAVVVVVGSAMLTRAARGPVWAQVLVMMAALLLLLTLLFPSGGELLRFLPTAATFEHFNDLLVLAGQQIRVQAVPVPDLDALLLLATLGIGLVAVVVDLVAVGLRRPALAGLPMLAMYSVPVAVLPDGVPVVTFLFAAVGFLWLLVTDSVDRIRRFGRRFTGEGRDVDIWEPSPLAAAGRRLGLVGLIVAIVLPVAIPGLSSGLLDSLRPGRASSGSGGVGLSGSTVDLNAYLTDQLLVRDKVTPMVQVTTTDPSPYYLRFGVADTVRNNGFVPRPSIGRALSDITGTGTPDVPGVTNTAYKANIRVLAGFSMSLAPAYSQVVAVRGLNNDWLYDANENVIFSRAPTAANTEYSIDYVRSDYTPAALESANGLTPEQKQEAVVPTVAYVTDLLTQLLTGKTTEYDQVRAIYDYFTEPANNFKYSLVAPVSKSNNPIVDFLTSKTGFCVQYAAAMAWLARAAGYPARVAFGFTRGPGAGAGGVYTLTNFNLHAWTEVFFPRFGWIPFDSTPPGAVPGAVQSQWAPNPLAPNQNQVGPSANPSVSPSDEPGNIPRAGGAPPSSADGSGSGSPINAWLLGGMALLAAIVVMALMPALRRRALTRRRRARGGQTIDLDVGSPGAAGRVPGSAGQLVTDPAAVAMARRDAHEAWAELQDTLVDFRVDVDDAETPRATAQRVALLLNQGFRDQTQLLGRAEERARYARTPLRADGLNQALRAVRSALAQRATRWERFAATILPRSVLLRWRLAFINRVAAVIAASARARMAVSAANPRRALSRARS